MCIKVDYFGNRNLIAKKTPTFPVSTPTLQGPAFDKFYFLF